MDKKAQSKPMREIVARLVSYGEFEVVFFGDDIILNAPVEAWPAVDALLSWHSDGFPLKRAQQYIALRKPFCINDLHAQDVLLDRRRVYKLLEVCCVLCVCLS
jgi:inositol hexakisphosphate/diphosphoinositol-pentakisphosphate kinase